MKYLNPFYCLFASLAVISCTSQEDAAYLEAHEEETGAPRKCEMIFNVTKTEFDGQTAKRADAPEWKDGDKIYLTFDEGEGVTYGDAVYDDGIWTLSYYGGLTQGMSARCSAVYFENPQFESGQTVILSEDTGIYEDGNGSYIFDEGTMRVVANLRPKTGRLRFAGSDGDKIKIYGISHYTTFNISNGEFTASKSALSKTVEAGYTPYIYGEFSNPDKPRLNVITETSGYTRMMPPDIYRAGESGFMNIPTETSHNGWQNTLIFNVNGVDFTMIPVQYEEGNFLLAQTETTEQLYNAVMEENPTDSRLPKHELFYDKWIEFIERLNSVTALEFRMPTIQEWQYAFAGGNKSTGCTYSGSDIISNVAWYKGNSNGTRHPVGQLQPNELGFYDMSGNVSELVKDGLNPTHELFGGYWDSDENSCLKTSKLHYTYYKYSGFRPALSVK